MRVGPVVAAVFLVSGCSLGTDAALTGQDAKSAIGAKNSAFQRLASTELTTISQEAQAWAAAHGGSMAGFSDDLRTSQPSLAATAVVLTDAQVSLPLQNGQCLTVMLPAGAPTPTPC